MSLKNRLLFAIIFMVVMAVLVTGFVSYRIATGETEGALKDSVKERLLSQDIQTKEALDEYFGTISAQVRTVSAASATADAAVAFRDAYDNYLQQREPLTGSQRSQVTGYYTDEFASQYANLNPSPLGDVTALVNPLDDTSIALQYDFIAGSSFALGEKDGLQDLGNGTDYAEAHSRYHEDFRTFLRAFEYYDIFIADIDTGNIVYSVFKELDYATSISTGPYAQTGIGEAFRLAKNADEPDQVFFSRFDRYRPSYDALAGFASSPIYVDGRAIAVLIFQMPLAHLNNILTHDNGWQDKGFGASGETYLVTPKGVLLNESRFFVEDKINYLAAIRKTYPDVAEEIEARDTSVGIQPVNSSSSSAALSGRSGFGVIKDYRDVEVYSAYSPIDIGGKNYALMAEVDVEEALAPLERIKSDMAASILVVALVLVAIAVGLSLMFANRLIRPLKILGQTCEELTEGEGDLTVKLKHSGVPEIDRIADNFNIFIEQLRALIAQVKNDADSIATASHQLSATTSQSEGVVISQREQTAGVATSMQQLSSAINEISESTEATNRQSVEAQTSLKENMERANLAAKNIQLLVNLIKESSETIVSLKQEVGQITSLLSVITSIADQTNLLALNAAIEAARAGEAGRGFSVVADEVRALANRTQESTVEISNVIEKMNQSSELSVERMENASTAADGGSHLVDLVSSAMRDLNENLDRMLTLSQQVADATDTQSKTSGQVASNVDTINQMSQEVEVGAKQSRAAAEELAIIAARTQELVARFRT